MFVDAKTLPQRFSIDVDVCIVGAGAAGITLARDLSGGNRKIAVLESGNFDFEAATQALYAGEVAGKPYSPLDRDRLRYFGGTTNHWEGSCRPFDALDLADWPISANALAPFYRRAQEVCQLSPDTFDAPEWSVDEARPLPLDSKATLKSGVFQYSPPTRFGTVYREDLATAPGVTIYLNANLVQIETNEAASTVTGLEVACLNGIRGHARARYYVLAAGGIENVRLLLNADQVQKSGLGNEFDLVGRYFMDHPFVPRSATIAADPASPVMRFYNQHQVRGRLIEGYFCASDEVRREEQLPPFAIGVRPANVQIDAGLGRVTLPPGLRNLVSDDFANRLSFYLPRFAERLEAPAVWMNAKMWRNPPGSYYTVYTCGPPPDPESRVTLSDKVDALGMRETRLDWHLPANFESSMQRAHELLARELGRTGLGRLRMESSATTGYDPLTDLGIGHHHMGTTRMHDDPRHGVVDADCRVHGIGNLFIAGSSVFTSYACDDPTLTVVALALRMSDHLKSVLS